MIHGSIAKVNKPTDLNSSIQVQRVLALREAQQSLKDRLEVAEGALKSAEQEVIELLQGGANFSHCGHEVSIINSERRYPAWKEHFISRLGKADADQVLESTRPVIIRKLVIK